MPGSNGQEYFPVRLQADRCRGKGPGHGPLPPSRGHTGTGPAHWVHTE